MGADGSLEHIMPETAVQIPSGVGESVTASGTPAIQTSGGVFGVTPKR